LSAGGNRGRRERRGKELTRGATGQRGEGKKGSLGLALKKENGPAAGPCGEGREGRVLGLGWPMREGKEGARDGKRREEGRSAGLGWPAVGLGCLHSFLLLFFFLFF
jgi:hypothetical protein